MSAPNSQSVESLHLLPFAALDLALHCSTHRPLLRRAAEPTIGENALRVFLRIPSYACCIGWNYVINTIRIYDV
jgi:hypothetical protein